MQALERNGLSAAQVTALLTAPTLVVSAGCDLMNPDLSFAADISDDLAGGRVERNLFATIHGTCSLKLSRRLAWGVDLVRPFQVLTDGHVTARFDLGVFCMTTPVLNVGDSVPMFDVQGYDRLMLLDRQVGADYTIAAAVTYRKALLDVFTAAGLTGVLIDGAAADDTLPVARSWPLIPNRAADPDQTDSPVTWLRIVNDLLRAINFRSVWCDERGRFRCQGYQLPSARPPEFTFDADGLLHGAVGEDRTVSEDVWRTPNRWVFRWTNAPEGTATANLSYTYNLPASDPMSAASRGLVWTSVVDYEAASRAKLVEIGDRRVQSDRTVTTRYTVSVGPFPVVGHADIYTYRDLAAAADRKVQAVTYTVDLLGADTEMTWEAV